MRGKDRSVGSAPFPPAGQGVYQQKSEQIIQAREDSGGRAQGERDRHHGRLSLSLMSDDACGCVHDPSFGQANSKGVDRQRVRTVPRWSSSFS